MSYTIGLEPDRVTTLPEFAMGEEGKLPGRTYVYVQANGAIEKWGACIVRGAWQATPGTTTNASTGLPVCIPQVAIPDNSYGWGLVAGTGRSRTGGAVTNNNGLAFSGTAGELINAAGTDDLVGAVATANDGANDGPVLLWYPSVGS